MIVTLDRDALVKAMTRLARVVERRTTVPIIQNVLIETTDGGIMLKATDLDLEIRDTVYCDISQAGSLTVAATTLLDIGRKLPLGAQIELQTDNDSTQLVVRSGRSRFRLNTLPADNFPSMDAGQTPHEFTLACSDLKRLVDKTQFAISTEEVRYYLNGIYLHHAEDALDGAGALRAVATDGHRLAMFDLPLPEGAGEMPGVIIPRKTVAEIFKLADDSETVGITLSSSKICLTFGGVTLVSKLIDGTFPDYRRVIPQGNDRTLVLETGEFTRAIDRVSSISSERGRAAKLTLCNTEDVTINTINPDAGSASETITAEFTGEAVTIGFNHKYLIDIANHVEGKKMRMEIGGSSSPAVIRSETETAELFVLMPMMV